jgi:hypothetical protein
MEREGSAGVGGDGFLAIGAVSVNFPPVSPRTEYGL